MNQKIDIEIKTEYIKLDQLLKFAGLAESGGAAKEDIVQGAVLLNGRPEKQRGRKVTKGDTVFFEDVEIHVC